jgi:hypothetical protein
MKEAYRLPEKINKELDRQNKLTNKMLRFVRKFTKEEVGVESQSYWPIQQNLHFLPKERPSPMPDFLTTERMHDGVAYRFLIKHKEGKRLRNLWVKTRPEFPMDQMSILKLVTGGFWGGFTIEEIDGERILTSWKGWEPKKLGYIKVELSVLKEVK